MLSFLPPKLLRQARVQGIQPMYLLLMPSTSLQVHNCSLHLRLLSNLQMSSTIQSIISIKTSVSKLSPSYNLFLKTCYHDTFSCIQCKQNSIKEPSLNP